MKFDEFLQCPSAATDYFQIADILEKMGLRGKQQETRKTCMESARVYGEWFNPLHAMYAGLIGSLWTADPAYISALRTRIMDSHISEEGKDVFGTMLEGILQEDLTGRCNNSIIEILKASVISMDEAHQPGYLCPECKPRTPERHTYH